METKDYLERIGELHPGILSADGFEDCLIGLAERACSEPVLAYDREKCIQKLIRDGMDREEAEEFFEYNTLGASVGDRTPVFIDTNMEM